MVQTCRVCIHSDRKKIDQEIIKGTSLRDIAGQFSISKSAIDRHKRDHLPDELVKAAAAKERRDAQELLNLMDDLLSEAKDVIKSAKKSKDHRTRLMGIREGRETASRLLELTLVANIEKRLRDLETGEGPEKLTGE
jgi:hypothetical protein